MKQNNKNLIFIGIIILAIAVIFLIQKPETFSFLGIGGDMARLPLETKTIDWMGNQVYAESPKFGSIASTSTQGFTCNSNNGIVISNDISSNGNVLTLSSSVASPDADCNGNGLNATVTLPPGKLEYRCQINGAARIQSADQSSGNCNIQLAEVEVYNWGYGGDEFAWSRVGISSVINNNSITFSESSHFTFTVYSRSNTNEATTLQLTFTSLPSNQTYFRLLNSQCFQISLSPSSKTSNDYDTLTECQAQIETPQTYYRLSSNACNSILLFPSAKTSNDYTTLALCQSHINQSCTQEAKLCPDGSYVSRTGPNCEFAICPNGTAQTYYRFAGNECTAIQLTTAQKTANDYTTRAVCESHIIIIGDPTILDKYFVWAAFFDVTFDGKTNGTDGLILVSGAVVVFLILISSRKRKR